MLDWIKKEIREQFPFARFEFYKWGLVVIGGAIITFFVRAYSAFRAFPDRYFYGLLFIVSCAVFYWITKSSQRGSVTGITKDAQADALATIRVHRSVELMPLAEEDPKVYLVPKNSEFRKTGIIPFDLFNQGQRVNVAHRIAVQPIPKVPSVSFEYVNHLEMNQHKELLPIIGDVSVFQTHNILPILERAWTEECKATGEAKDKFPFEITILYEDVSGQRKFETKVSLIYSPGTQVVAGLDAMSPPHKEHKIIEVAGMKVRRLS